MAGLAITSACSGPACHGSRKPYVAGEGTAVDAAAVLRRIHWVAGCKTGKEGRFVSWKTLFCVGFPSHGAGLSAQRKKRSHEFWISRRQD